MVLLTEIALGMFGCHGMNSYKKTEDMFPIVRNAVHLMESGSGY